MVIYIIDLVILSKEELKEVFDCFGHFYYLKINENDSYYCRSVLEIVKKDSIPENVNQLSIDRPDALFILMNPGSSTPDKVAPQYTKEEYLNLCGFNINFTQKKLVKAVFDDTQEVVMNIMHYKKWAHVRIINLLDFRHTDSSNMNIFIKRFNTKCIICGFQDIRYIHSIFSPYRDSERTEALRIKEGAPIILGWSRYKFLKAIARKGFQDISSLGLSHYGLCKKETDVLYYHPQRKKLWWIQGILNQLEKGC